MTLLAILVVAAQAVAPDAPVRQPLVRAPLATSPGVAQEPLATRSPSTPCAAVAVRAPGFARRTPLPDFSSRQILDLQLRPRLRYEARGDHLMHLKVFTPRGYLYQVITIPFVGANLAGARTTARAAGASSTQAEPPPRVIAGLPHPVPAQRLVPVSVNGRRAYELTARLPVAGTSITMSSLFGQWSVQPWLDDSPEPCGPATRFTIRE